MQDYTKQMQDMASSFAEQLKASMPKVTFNKNGYEIRAHVLEMAQNQVWQDYHSKWGQFEASLKKEGGELVTRVEIPTAPGIDKVLDAAEKFYNFVNSANNK